MTVFNTLLRREWLQHQNGWLLLVVLPACIASSMAMQAGRATSSSQPFWCCSHSRRSRVLKTVIGGSRRLGGDGRGLWGG